MEARVSATLPAPVAEVWLALTTPATIKEYFFGADVETDWQEGSAIKFRGEWQGKAYEDRGEIQDVEPGRRLVYTHWSALSGAPDRPENYDTVTYELEPIGEDATKLTILQDGAGDEQSKAESEKNWKTVLDGLKDVLAN